MEGSVRCLLSSEMLGERLGVEIRRDLTRALFRSERDVSMNS